MASSPPAPWCYLVVLAVLAAVLLPLLHPIHRPFTSSPRIFPRTDTDPSRASGRISFTIRPRSMTTTLPARRATAGVWETMIAVRPAITRPQRGQDARLRLGIEPARGLVQEEATSLLSHDR